MSPLLEATAYQVLTHVLVLSVAAVLTTVEPVQTAVRLGAQPAHEQELARCSMVVLAQVNRHRTRSRARRPETRAKAGDAVAR